MDLDRGTLLTFYFRNAINLDLPTFEDEYQSYKKLTIKVVV